MYRLCDANLRVEATYRTLAAAKKAAMARANENPVRVWFICDRAGNVLAGYGGNG